MQKYCIIFGHPKSTEQTFRWVLFLYLFLHSHNKGVDTMKTGALYIRVSTHMQDELSPDAQKRLLLDYAKANDIIVTKEFIFIESVSGRKADRRPEFQRMISLAKTKPTPFDTILVWKYSRFARNQEESIVYKSLLRKQCNIDVISVSEPIVDGPFGSLIERIIEWMDEYYSTRLSGEVMRGMSEKAMRGGYQARPPLGYRIEEKGKPPVIIPEEAEIIRLIFHKYVEEKCGFFDIARYLNVHGFKTSHGKNFEARSVQYIILNPTYCGMIRWNATDNETKKPKDESEWIIAKGHHEAIISKELFDAAQERFNSTFRPKGARPSSTYKHWLSGLMKCPDCGRTMIAKSVYRKSNGDAYAYFTCYGYSKGKCLGKNTISSMKLEPAVIEALGRVLDSKEVSYSYAKTERPIEKDHKEYLHEQLKLLSAKEKRIKDAYRDGIDTLEEYKENKIILLKERECLETELKECNRETDATKNGEELMLQSIQNVYNVITSEAFTNQQKNEALKSIIQKIVYSRENDELKIFYYLSEP